MNCWKYFFNQSISFLNNRDSIPTSCRLTQTHQYSLQQLHLLSQGYGGLETLNQFNTQFKDFIVASSGSRYWVLLSVAVHQRQ